MRTNNMNCGHFLLFVRIFRSNDSIVPSSDSELLMGDCVIVTGLEEYVEELRQEFQ